MSRFILARLSYEERQQLIRLNALTRLIEAGSPNVSQANAIDIGREDADFQRDMRGKYEIPDDIEVEYEPALGLILEATD